MEIFERYRLVKNHDGYTLVLYLNQEPSEFSNEFVLALDNKRKTIQKNAADYLKNYIDKNLPADIKISAVKIMVGSLLIASLPFSSVVSPGAAQPTNSAPVSSASSANTANKSTAQKTTPPAANTAAKKPETVNNTNTSPSASKPVSSSTVSNPASILAVVNKNHSLPASYIPANLVVPNVAFPYSGFYPKMQMRQDAAGALEALFAAALRDNVKLYAISGYRSYQTQKDVFASNVRQYGSTAAANQFSAMPGESEHQTGLAMDVSSPSVGNALTQSFANTREGKWLAANAPKYGFIIRFPKGKEGITGYQYEPWHVRYVGKDAAMAISQQGITLEQYMGIY